MYRKSKYENTKSILYIYKKKHNDATKQVFQLNVSLIIFS